MIHRIAILVDLAVSVSTTNKKRHPKLGGAVCLIDQCATISTTFGFHRWQLRGTSQQCRDIEQGVFP